MNHLIYFLRAVLLVFFSFSFAKAAPTALELARFAEWSYSITTFAALPGGWQMSPLTDYRAEGFLSYQPHAFSSSSNTPATLVVALPGTQDLNDWALNIDSQAASCPFIFGFLAPHIKVHSGYCGWATYLAGKIEKKIGEILQEQKYETFLLPLLYFVGHSKGGAEATLISLYFKQRGYPTHLMTFGTPPLGNQAFMRELEQAMPATSHRTHYVMNGDLIPLYNIESLQNWAINSLDPSPTPAHVLDENYLPLSPQTFLLSCWDDLECTKEKSTFFWQEINDNTVGWWAVAQRIIKELKSLHPHNISDYLTSLVRITASSP